MIRGIALARWDVPCELLAQPDWSRHEVTRASPLGMGQAEPELCFLRQGPTPVLPVWHEDRLHLVRWGNPARSGPWGSTDLPIGGAAQLASAVAGRWVEWQPVPVDVPAALGLDGLVWYQVTQGFRGLLVRDEQGTSRVYLLVEPATHYYQVMTRSKWMPVLIGERI